MCRNTLSAFIRLCVYLELARVAAVMPALQCARGGSSRTYERWEDTQGKQVHPGGNIGYEKGEFMCLTDGFSFRPISIMLKHPALLLHQYRMLFLAPGFNKLYFEIEHSPPGALGDGVPRPPFQKTLRSFVGATPISTSCAPCTLGVTECLDFAMSPHATFATTRS